MKNNSVNNTKKYLNNIDITYIEVTEKKLYLFLDKYIIENSHIYVHAIIHKNMHKNLSRKELEQYIIENNPSITLITEQLEADLYYSYAFKRITDEGIYLNDDLFYP